MKLTWDCDLDNPKDLALLLNLEDKYQEFKNDKCKCLEKEDCECLSFNKFCHNYFEYKGW